MENGSQNRLFVKMMNNIMNTRDYIEQICKEPKIRTLKEPENQCPLFFNRLIYIKSTQNKCGLSNN